MMDFVLKRMGYILNMMDLLLNMMDLLLKMTATMDFTRCSRAYARRWV